MDTYNVMTLAPKNAGKTVFLAAMFNRLGVQRPGLGFFLDMKLEQAKALNGTYREVIAPARSWPESTQLSELSEWDFTCCVRAAGQVYQVLSVSYLDFAGERLTEVGDGDAAVAMRFEQRIRDANALLVILDGEKLMYLMRGDPDGEIFMRVEMATIFQRVNSAVGSIPIHFVITKWDTLESAYTLAQVRDRLMEYEDFADLVTEHDEKNVIRLIPVSAVGQGFATLDEQTGEMRKTGAPFGSSVNIEVPFAALLTDRFNMIAKAISQAPRTSGQQTVGHVRDALIKVLGKGKGKLPSSVREGLPGPVADAVGGISDELLSAAIDFLSASAGREELARRRVTDHQSALRETVASFGRRIDQFEREFPGSRVDLEPVR